jgi:hypothetical protein
MHLLGLLRFLVAVLSLAHVRFLRMGYGYDDPVSAGRCARIMRYVAKLRQCADESTDMVGRQALPWT